MDFRVASNLASFGASSGEVPGRPATSILLSRLPMSPRVAPAPASSGLAGNGSSSCLESRILQHIRCLSSELPRSFALPVAPADGVPGLPRFLHLPAVPATDIRVAPNLASFGASGAVASGCPAASRFQKRLPVELRVAPHSFTFRLCLGFESPGRPEFSLPRLRLMDPRVSSDLAPSGFAVPASSGCPESCIYGWVDDDFPVLLELCILG
jgi:hypothetical protein